MQIKFKLTRWELFLGLMLMQFTITINIIILLIGIGAVTFVSYSIAKSTYDGDILISIFVFLVFLFIQILIMFILFLILTAFSAFSAKNKTIVSEQSMTFNDNMFISSSEYGRSEIYWKIVQRVVVLGSFCFLFVSQMGAIIIPKRAFASNQEWKEFINLCRSKLQK